MSFIRKSKEPPKVEERHVIEAKIVDVKYPVKSKNYERENVQFVCELSNGY